MNQIFFFLQKKQFLLFWFAFLLSIVTDTAAAVCCSLQTPSWFTKRVALHALLVSLPNNIHTTKTSVNGVTII